MSLQIWKQKPEWWDSFIAILEKKLENRDTVILNKENLKAYLLMVEAIDLRDRGYRTILAMTREALIQGEWSNGIEAIRISRHSIKVMRRDGR